MQKSSWASFAWPWVALHLEPHAESLWHVSSTKWSKCRGSWVCSGFICSCMVLEISSGTFSFTCIQISSEWSQCEEVANDLWRSNQMYLEHKKRTSLLGLYSWSLGPTVLICKGSQLLYQMDAEIWFYGDRLSIYGTKYEKIVDFLFSVG